MLLHRVMVVAVVVVAAAGQPQRGRQTPFSMGMRLLENLRNGMTSTLQNFFGGGPTRGKEVGPPPGHQQAPNLDPAPPHVEKPAPHSHHQDSHFLPPHPNEFHPPAPHSLSHPPPPPRSRPPPSHTTSHNSPAAAPHFPQERPKPSFSSPSQGPTSFFKVVHEPGSTAPRPDSHGFSGESLHPDDFLSGPPPFQGTVEEDHLVSVVQEVPAPLPLQNNHLPQDSFPPHKSATSFASFGNTASFKLGTLQRNKPEEHHPPRPRSILQDPSLPPGEGHHHSLRQDTQRSGDQPTVILLSNSRLSTAEPATQAFPPDTPTSSRSFEDQRQHHVAKKASASIHVQEAQGNLNTGTRTARDAAVDDDADKSSYEFGYGVLDDASGNHFFHSELQEDGETRGSYKTKLPDGRVQTVTYVVNNRGFHPKITYDQAPDTNQDL